MYLRALGAAIALLAGGCKAPPYRVHEVLLADRAASAPATVLLIPPSVDVYVMTDGSARDPVVEHDSLRTAMASARFEEALDRSVLPFDVVEPLPLDATEQALLAEHLKHWHVIAPTAFEMTGRPDRVWRERRAHFDYTLGTGLGFLAERSGVDAALIIGGSGIVRKVTSSDGTGRDRSTTSRTFGEAEAVRPWRSSYLNVSVVDLRTGDLLWMSQTTIPLETFGPSGGFGDADAAVAVIAELLAPYPGLAEYAAEVGR